MTLPIVVLGIGLLLSFLLGYFVGSLVGKLFATVLGIKNKLLAFFLKIVVLVLLFVVLGLLVLGNEKLFEIYDLMRGASL